MYGKIRGPVPALSLDVHLARRSLARLKELDVDTIFFFAHGNPIREGAKEKIRALAESF